MRKTTGLLAILALTALASVAFPDSVKAIFGFSARESTVAASEQNIVVVGANKDKPGYPYVMYAEPKPALDTAKTAAGPSNVVAAAAADFDSDGMQDIVSVDTNGQLRVMSGNANSLFPAHAAEGSDTSHAFSRVSASTGLTFVPDEILVGDFNADGKSDVILVKAGLDALLLMPGDGHGNFLAPVKQYVGGTVGTAVAGEIGRPDGQTDVSVSLSVSGRSFVAVFEHPTGAFAQKPEYFALGTMASSMTIGQLDKDPFGDVAVVGGELLTVIHGRGNPYPLDRLPDSNIERPSAIVNSKQLSFTARAIVAAEMDGTRGDGLAMLGSDGRMHYFKANTATKLPKTQSRAKVALNSLKFVPSGIDPTKYALAEQKTPQNEQEADAAGLLMADTEELRSLGRKKLLEKRSRESATERSSIPAAQLAAEDAAKAARQLEVVAERKRLFEAGLAGKPVGFSEWEMKTVAADARLAVAAASGSVKLIRARASVSGVDDLLVADRTTNSVLVVGRWQEKGKAVGAGSVVALETNTSPTAIVPMRLNADGMSDIVTFSGSGAEPSVLLSQPATVFTVNTADDAGGGNCQGDGQPCSLRRALFWANFTPNNMIVFNIPGAGVHTIHLNSQLPDIVTGTTLDATTQPGYIGKPLIEIRGDLLTGAKEGLRTARPNVTIRGFAVNGMPGIEEGSSVIGGSGIVILSYLGEPLATNVTIESNFLGTDPDGTADLGNDGNGIQIYDADSNNIGGTIPQARNLLSGNGVIDEEGTKQGVGFAITGGNFNRVYNNYVGTDLTGALSVGNFQGAFVTGTANEIGGDQPGMGNVISGNGGPLNSNGQCYGQGISVVQLYSPSTGEALTDGTQIKGNLIGTSANGLFKVRNCTTGVSSTGNLNTTIGSITSEGRNTISGNDWDAIWCGYNDSAFFPISGGCYIVGNEIGTNINGNASIANTEENNSCIGFCLITDTIWLPTEPIDFALVGSPGQTAPESACQGNCNLISGNRSIEGASEAGRSLKQETASD
ncbi:MAG: VCBS repeat-containing protein [Acidobacteria bacterium]|nr:VCBS repeat-containing protein [Acidobacteriota bacterium]